MQQTASDNQKSEIKIKEHYDTYLYNIFTFQLCIQNAIIYCGEVKVRLAINTDYVIIRPENNNNIIGITRSGTQQ